MLTRTRRIIRGSGTFLIPLPPDWVRSRGLGPGDKVEITYDEIVRVRPVRKSVASDDGVTAPAVPVRRPAQPAETDKGGLVGDGS